MGQQGQIYLAAVLPNGAIVLMDANGNYSPFVAGKPIPSIYAGTLPKQTTSRNLIRNSDLRGLAGTSILIGYGLGVGTAADAELLGSARFNGVLQVR